MNGAYFFYTFVTFELLKRGTAAKVVIAKDVVILKIIMEELKDLNFKRF